MYWSNSSIRNKEGINQIAIPRINMNSFTSSPGYSKSEPSVKNWALKFLSLAVEYNKRNLFVSNCVIAREKESLENLFPCAYITFGFDVQITLLA